MNCWLPGHIFLLIFTRTEIYLLTKKVFNILSCHSQTILLILSGVVFKIIFTSACFIVEELNDDELV